MTNAANFVESSVQTYGRYGDLTSQKYLTRIGSIVTCATALVFLPVFSDFSNPWLMYFYVPLLVMAALPMLPYLQSRPTAARMVLFVSTNGLAIVTALHFGEESRINVAALVSLCHTLMVTRLREYALLGFGIGLTTCTLLIYQIVPDGLIVPVGQYPQFASQLSGMVQFAAVMIVGIQIVVLRVKLMERTERLRESSNSLHQQVEKLSESNRELNTAKEANATLVRILCHDLATPVSTIDLCLNRPGLTEREVEIIRRSVKKLKETISNVRDLQRFHASKVELSRTSEDVTKLLVELKDSFSAELLSKEIELVIRGHDSVATCLVDRSLVANQVFANVLRNAIKFSKRNSRIEVAVLHSGKTVSVQFRDYGIGIPEELLAKLFDPLQRTSRPGTEKESGTGFGMPIVKACMEEMGGAIVVQSWTGTPQTEVNSEKLLQPQGTLVELRFEAASSSASTIR